MGEIDEPQVGKESPSDAQQSRESSPLWIVISMMLLLVALVVWYRLK